MKMHSYVSPFLLSAALACLPIGLSAQQYPEAGSRQPDQAQGNNQNMSKMSSSDTKFVQKAAQGGLAEVQLGQMAQEKASSDAVKQFGARMVHDHADANKKLEQIAQRDGIPVPKTLDAKDQMLKQHLEKLSGPAFDRAYMQNMVKDHKQDVAEFEHEANSGKNADVKQFAADTVPTLKSHLQQAEQIAPQQKASTNSGGTR